MIFQHYWPEQFRATDIAENLVKEGHEVTVLCGLPNYPHGFVLDEYRHGRNRVQVRNGVKILRVKEIGRRNNVLFRMLNYWSYPHYAKKYLKKHHLECDVVLTVETSPIMMCKPALFYKKRYKKKVLMYAMDLWPESLLAGGITNRSIVYKHYTKVSARIYSQCDKILVTTNEHIGYIKSLPGCQSLDIECLPQYAESIFEEGDFESEDNGIIDLMFAGNVGKAQSVGTLVKAAAILKDDSRFRFHIVGGGSELENVIGLANSLGLDNVVFYGQKPIEEMTAMYKLADAMLVTLEDKPYANMTVPGKVQSYMAAGKAIIGSVRGSCASLIHNNGLGYVCDPGDENALATLIKGLNYNDLVKTGSHSREVYSQSFCQNSFMSRLIHSLAILQE